jgi:hypothetical protein
VALTKPLEAPYVVDLDFLEHTLRLSHNSEASKALLRLAAKQLESRRPLTDDVREYLSNAVKVLLNAVEDSTAGRVDAGKQVLESLGIKAHHRRRTVDRSAIGAEIAMELTTGASKNQSQARSSVAKKYGISPTTAWKCYREYLCEQANFQRVREIEKRLTNKRRKVVKPATMIT